MSLLVSLKDKLSRDFNSFDLGNSFRQIENWANSYPTVNQTTNRPYAFAAPSGNTTCNSGVSTLVPVVFTVSNYAKFSISASGVVLPLAGIWLIEGSLNANNSSSTITAQIKQNSTVVIGNGTFAQAGMTLVQGAKGDVITLNCFQSTGAAITVFSGGGTTNLKVIWLGAL